MAKNITLMGANYPDVPAVNLPKTGGGTARFIDPDEYAAVDITSQCTFYEDITGTDTHIYYKNGCVYVFYQGEIKSHTDGSSGSLLFLLPSGYRPMTNLYIPFVVGGSAYGLLLVSTNGNVRVNSVSSTVTGRVVSSFVFPVA